jgi:hypothetical protein
LPGKLCYSLIDKHMSEGHTVMSLSQRTQRLLTVGLLTWALVSPSPVFAGTKPPFPIAGTFSHLCQTFSGLNFAAKAISQTVASKVAEHKLGGKVKVKLRLYNATDLMAGKIKSAEITAKGCTISGAKLDEIDIATNGPLWYRLKSKPNQRRGIGTPVLLSINGHLSEQACSQGLSNPKIAQALSALKLELPGLGSQQLQILEPKVKMDQGKVQIAAWLATTGATTDTGVPITICATPYLEGDSKICLKDATVNCPVIENPDQFGSFFTELLNPLVNFGRMDRLDHAFRMQSLEVKPSRMDFAGRLILAPKPNPTVAQNPAPTHDHAHVQAKDKK